MNDCQYSTCAQISSIHTHSHSCTLLHMIARISHHSKYYNRFESKFEYIRMNFFSLFKFFIKWNKNSIEQNNFRCLKCSNLHINNILAQIIYFEFNISNKNRIIKTKLFNLRDFFPLLYHCQPFFEFVKYQLFGVGLSYILHFVVDFQWWREFNLNFMCSTEKFSHSISSHVVVSAYSNILIFRKIPLKNKHNLLSSLLIKRKGTGKN